MTLPDPDARLMLDAIVAMGLLHMTMLGWLYATRIPAMFRARLTPQSLARPGVLDKLPAWARNPADNYNNLFQAPTLFYAITIAVILLGLADAFHAACAWLFVAGRIVHSLIQATVNIVVARLVFFSLAWLALGVMIVRAALFIL